MISYIKIEIFAYDLFHTVWFKGGLISRKYDATEIYKDEGLSENDYKEVCDKLFYDAVLCRRILFQRIFMAEIIKEKDKYCDSLSDFYNYINSTCYRYEWFDCLTVFEKMLATCAFVLNLCFYNRENENVDIIKFGHVCWATYFDAFTEEFYEQGGWIQLKNAANSYTLPLRFLQMYLSDPENAIVEVTTAIENYNNLKQTSIIHECKTVSKLWVKSHNNNLQRYSDNPVEFAGYENCLHTEHILNELKRLCSPNDLEVLQYDEECSERSIFDSDSFYIPLTPITSEESMGRTNSFSVSSDISFKDALLESSSDEGEISSEVETDDSDFTNQFYLSELEETTSSNYCDHILSGSLDAFKQPIELGSICVILDSELELCLSRSMTKMLLNHTLELAETKISETEFSCNSNDRYSVEHYVINTTDEILVSQEMMNKQCQIREDWLDAVELVTNDTSAKVLSVSEGKTSHNKCFKEGKCAFVVASLSNTVFSHEDQIFISTSEWDENDLAKKISTPIKQKQV